jgi:hypothetical protein
MKNTTIIIAGVGIIAIAILYGKKNASKLPAIKPAMKPLNKPITLPNGEILVKASPAKPETNPNNPVLSVEQPSMPNPLAAYGSYFTPQVTPSNMFSPAAPPLNPAAQAPVPAWVAPAPDVQPVDPYWQANNIYGQV